MEMRLATRHSAMWVCDWGMMGLFMGQIRWTKETPATWLPCLKKRSWWVLRSPGVVLRMF